MTVPADSSGWTFEWTTPGRYSFAKDRHMVVFSADDMPVGTLVFQDGPVREHGYNGVSNEVVIAALISRLEALNQPPYNSQYNDRALGYLRSAYAELNARTRSRESRGVEGTSTP